MTSVAGAFFFCPKRSCYDGPTKGACYIVTMSFYYIVTWREATEARRRLAGLDTGYSVTTLPGGEVAFMFPDLPVRTYAEVRKIFGSNGIPLDNFG